MAVFQLGVVIRNRREELGLSQEDLADGICSVPTLSRIENGTRMPSKDHFECLMQRLGYSAMSMDFFTSDLDFTVHKLKSEIRQAYIARNMALAAQLLDRLVALLDEPSAIAKQFLLLYKTLLSKEILSREEKLARFEEALRLTCPSYQQGNFTQVLSYEEIILLNNIAIWHGEDGDHEKAIHILTAVKEYHDHRIASPEESWRTQTMILYNLSNHLGLAERYDECITICDKGILAARTSGRCSNLSKMLFNKGWAMHKRNMPGDQENAKRYITQAYDLSQIMGKQKEATRIKEVYLEFFGLELPER